MPAQRVSALACSSNELLKSRQSRLAKEHVESGLASSAEEPTDSDSGTPPPKRQRSGASPADRWSPWTSDGDPHGGGMTGALAATPPTPPPKWGIAKAYGSSAVDLPSPADSFRSWASSDDDTLAAMLRANPGRVASSRAQSNGSIARTSGACGGEQLHSPQRLSRCQQLES